VPSLEEVLGDRLVAKEHDTELWEFEYKFYPYLKNVSDSDLDVRYHALYRNLMFLICELRDSLPIRSNFLSSWWWLKKRVQMLMEYRARNRGPPERLAFDSYAVSGGPLCKPNWPNESRFVVRYSEERWLRDLLDRGSIRITPASTYKGEMLDEARKDDELNLYSSSLGDKVTITTADGRKMPIIGDLKRTQRLRVNYYVLCAANEYDHRLFSCFPSEGGDPAEACAVVWNTQEFARRLELVGKLVLPKLSFHHGVVSYFDPYDLRQDEYAMPGASKDFSYAYQREYRFLWLPPPTDITPKYPLFFNVGPLSDIVGLFRRDGTHIAGRRAW